MRVQCLNTRLALISDTYITKKCFWRIYEKYYTRSTLRRFFSGVAKRYTQLCDEQRAENMLARCFARLCELRGQPNGCAYATRYYQFKIQQKNFKQLYLVAKRR